MGAGLSPWQIFCMGNLPKFSKLLKHSLIPPDVIDFFANICKSQLDKRQKGLVPKRNDFLDVLLEGMQVGVFDTYIKIRWCKLGN